MTTVPRLSEWLQVMLGEINRKREENDAARAEDERRHREAGVGAESGGATPAPTQRKPVARGTT